MKTADLPSVCIVGKPNVGKSTLFNRLIGSRRAVIHRMSGTTRDKIESVCEWEHDRFLLADMGGFIKDAPDRLSVLVKRQIAGAIKEADILLFVCDVRTGVTAQDEEVLAMIRKSGKDVILAVNKVDNKNLEDGIYDFYRLGFGNVYPISAMHNCGVNELLENIAARLKPRGSRCTERVSCKIAIAGRPNAGKSLFLNTLLKKERVIVDDKPGTTRDSIDTYFKKDGELYLLVDTAGIRHKRKVKEPIDVYSMLRSHEAIARSDVSFLIVDGYEGLRNDDIRIFNFIVNSGKCCIIIVNKWDLVKGIQMADYEAAILRKMPTIARYPVIFASAKSGRNLSTCVATVKTVIKSAQKRVATGELNKITGRLKYFSSHAGKMAPRIYYIVQTSVGPPEFLLFVNNPRLATESFTNRVERVLRKEHNFYGTPIKIKYRKKSRKPVP